MDFEPKFAEEMEVWEELVNDIFQGLERVEGTLEDIREECQGLKKAGMYPAVASESWQPRNGKGSYLRMVFPRGTSGMPRKLYVGNKPEAITEARRMNANRRRWEELDKIMEQLAHFLKGIRYELGNLARRLAHYQVPDLGIAVGPLSAGDVPKSEIASSLCSSQ